MDSCSLAEENRSLNMFIVRKINEEGERVIKKIFDVGASFTKCGMLLSQWLIKACLNGPSVL